MVLTQQIDRFNLKLMSGGVELSLSQYISAVVVKFYRDKVDVDLVSRLQSLCDGREYVRYAELSVFGLAKVGSSVKDARKRLLKVGLSEGVDFFRMFEHGDVEELLMTVESFELFVMKGVSDDGLRQWYVAMRACVGFYERYRVALKGVSR